jgi:Fe-Mn family superoxide dismutase
MAFELPPLPYGFDALEPHIDAKTMEIHHDKHHATYVANANKALENHPTLAAKSVEDLLWGINEVPEDIRTVIRNNAGGHSNHSIFWTIMGPGDGGAPKGRIADSIKTTFGSYDAFKEQLQKTAVGQFTPTTSSTRTSGRTTSPPGSTRSTGTPSTAVSARFGAR